MTPVITIEQRRWRLATRHHLAETARTDDPVAIADDLVALHSSDPATVHLAVAARQRRPAIDAVERALYDDRRLVRHHAMRRTLWVMTPEVTRLAHAAATERIARAERKRTLDAFSTCHHIDDAARWLDRATAEIVELLRAEGPLATRAIGDALPHLVVPVVFGAGTRNPATVNAHTRVLLLAGFAGRVLRGPPTGTWVSSEYRWHTAEAWLEEPLGELDEATAARRLVERWLRRFGPATETDVRWWFGWTASSTRRALAESRAVAVRLDDDTAAWLAEGDEEPVADPGPWVRLLPGLDPTSMGWKDRAWYLDPARAVEVTDRSGNLGPTVWADGRIVGSWGQRPDGEIVTDVDPTRLDPDQRAGLERAVERLTAVLDGVVVRPRFPSPAARALTG